MVGVRTNGPGRRWLTMAIAAKSGRFSPFVSGMLVKRLARLFAAFGLVTVAAYRIRPPRRCNSSRAANPIASSYSSTG